MDQSQKVVLLIGNNNMLYVECSLESASGTSSEVVFYVCSQLDENQNIDDKTTDSMEMDNETSIVKNEEMSQTLYSY